jgi:anti-sigma regulatory factor (Ser/Thr protein kinase)
MLREGEASAPHNEFLHSALLYGSDDEFVRVATPFIEQGIAAEQPVLVAVPTPKVELLRSALGGGVDGVSLLPAEEWFETSARTREKLARWGRERETARARVIGEPPWATGSEAQVRDWARHEAVTNIAFEGMGVDFICAYDERVLPVEILEHALHTHPALAGPGGHSASDRYEEPDEFCRRLDSRIGTIDGEPAAMLDVDLGELRRVRRLVSSMAGAVGIPGVRAEGLVLAVNEIAGNAVVHGSPPATLRIWSRDSEIVCEVSDHGAGIDDPFAGQFIPPLGGIGGRGIWLARMLCDAVEIRNGDGCTVSIHAVAPGGTAAGRLDRPQEPGVDFAEAGGPAQRHRQVQLRQDRSQHHFHPVLTVEG